MAVASVASHLILIVAAALLFYLAASDLRHFKIRNEAILVLTGLFFVHVVISGRWIEMHWNISLAALAFVFMLYWYNQGMMGGGDLKLMTVALLWTGVHCVLPFVVILVTVALLHTLMAKLGWVQAERVNGRIKVAFAPSIAAGLIGIFMLGCLSPL
jgi:prepilin peptidase CpaA